jgi:hypothetical protein
MIAFHDPSSGERMGCALELVEHSLRWADDHLSGDPQDGVPRLRQSLNPPVDVAQI